MKLLIRCNQEIQLQSVTAERYLTIPSTSDSTSKIWQIENKSLCNDHKAQNNVYWRNGFKKRLIPPPAPTPKLIKAIQYLTWKHDIPIDKRHRTIQRNLLYHPVGWWHWCMPMWFSWSSAQLGRLTGINPKKSKGRGQLWRTGKDGCKVYCLSSRGTVNWGL